jgi:hypothetical protein
MQGKQRLASLGVAAVLGLGVGAASAQGSAVEFNLGGIYEVSCDASFTGTKGAAVFLNATFSTCNFMGLPATVTQSGATQLLITSGPSGGWYSGNYTIPSGGMTTINVPLAGCTVTMPGPQTITHGTSGQGVRARNVTGGIEVDLQLNSLSGSASGCPFASGLVGMTTVTPAFVAGVTVP